MIIARLSAIVLVKVAAYDLFQLQLLICSRFLINWPESIFFLHYHCFAELVGIIGVLGEVYIEISIAVRRGVVVAR